MSRYTLKTFCGDKVIERFDHRSIRSLSEILNHPRHHCAGQTGPWGEAENHPDKFEIIDSYNTKLFSGNITDTINFVNTLR